MSAHDYHALHSLPLDVARVSLQDPETEHLKDELHDVVADIQRYLCHVHRMLLTAYRDLDTDDGRKMANMAVDNALFEPLWHDVLALFRLVYADKEAELERAMRKFHRSTPAMMGVAAALTLDDDALPSPHAFPYEPVVQAITAVLGCRSPQTKLNAIVRVLKEITPCVEQHYAMLGSTNVPVVGGDDVLPILFYCVVRCKLPQLYTECQTLEQFLFTSDMLGEEGYCLTSLLNAIFYVMNMHGQTQSMTTDSCSSWAE